MAEIVRLTRAGKSILIPSDKVAEYVKVGWEVAQEEGTPAPKAGKRAKKSLRLHRPVGNSQADAED